LWNPRKDGSPVDKRFVKNPPPNALIETVNHWDNPFFPPGLETLRKREQERLDPATYAHIWEGEYLSNSDSQVFANKTTVKDFSPGPGWDGPYFGGDFGFSQDPTAAVEVWLYDGCLYIHREAFKTGLELDDTAAYVTAKIPDFANGGSRWDNSRPESISHLTRHGLPRAVSVDKWPGSVEDGISYIRSFKQVVIHSRCTRMQSEARLYSYKVDRLTAEVSTDIVDAHNHGWDAVRYALSPMIRHRAPAGGITSAIKGLY
jgi:phage terminase large subunit